VTISLLTVTTVIVVVTFHIVVVTIEIITTTILDEAISTKRFAEPKQSFSPWS